MSDSPRSAHAEPSHTTHARAHDEHAGVADAHLEPVKAPKPKTYGQAVDHKTPHIVEHKTEHKADHKADHKHAHKAEHAPAHKAEHKSDHKSDHKADHKADHKVEPKADDKNAVTFASLELAAPILRAVTDEGYTIPTPIQARSIPTIIEGRDILGCAQTGTGKTAAFALPILHRLLKAPADKSQRGRALPRVLVLSPTRELACQIGESFATYGRFTGLTHTTIFGGVSQFHQTRSLDRGVDIIVATPGRLMDLMQQRLVDLSKIEVFVLDEADRMLDMGFIVPIRRIAASVPKTRQTLLFSATMPREIVGLADSLLRDPVKVSVTPVASAAPLIEQSVYMIDRSQKHSLLEHIIADKSVQRALVFTRTKRGADVVTKRLEQSGIPAVAIHGNKAQNQRTRALDGFKTGRTRVLVATDVAARGIDVDNITHVINYDIPNEPEAYVHRIGRTGRAGAKGLAIAMCDDDERGLLRDIERLTGKRIPIATPIADLPERKHSPSDGFSRDGRSHGGRPTRAPSHRSEGGGGGSGGGGGYGQDRPRRSHAGSQGSGGHSGGSHGGGTARPAGQAGTKKAYHRGQAPKGPASHPLLGGGHKAGPRTSMNHFRGKTRRPGAR